MLRREIVHRIGRSVLSITLLFATVISVDCCARQPQRPNIVIISIDDLNDWVGCLGGHPQAQTPNIDALASRGVLFSNAHCQSPLCNSSRTSWLIGKRPSTTGIYGLAPWFREVEGLAEHRSWPQYFEQNGYVTLATGKNYHDAYPPQPLRTDGGEFSVWGHHGHHKLPPKKFVETPDDIRLMDWGVYPENDREQDDYTIATWAVEHLVRLEEESKPWMLMVGFRRPHVPCYASQAWFDLYPEQTLEMPNVPADDRDDIPFAAWYLHWKLPEPRLSWLQSANQWKPLVQAYLASISFVDSQVGRILDQVDASGFADNTLIVLVSDHGFHLGEKAITGKNTLWEESTRIPLMFAGPGVSPGSTNASVEMLSIFPTLADLTGLAPRSDIEGDSLEPLIRDPSSHWPHPAITTHNQGNHSVRTRDFRLIRYVDGSEEFYDHKLDQDEFFNVIDDEKYVAEIERHRSFLPIIDRPAAPGSKHRVLTQESDGLYWEGTKINVNELVK